MLVRKVAVSTPEFNLALSMHLWLSLVPAAHCSIECHVVLCEGIQRRPRRKLPAQGSSFKAEADSEKRGKTAKIKNAPKLLKSAVFNDYSIVMLSCIQASLERNTRFTKIEKI